MVSCNPHVVIIGGGFGGLTAAIVLGKENIPVTIIDKNNFHLFQPLLYQVATGFLNTGDIASTLRAAVSRYKSVRAVQDEVRDIDFQNKEVISEYGKYKFDKLIIATGMSTSYFGRDEWAKYSCGLKTLSDSIQVRSRILTAFEAAERTSDPEERKKLLTFVIVGGGPTGVELAGALSELANRTLSNEFRNFNPADCKIILFEGGERLLQNFHKNISAYAKRSLEKLKIEIHTGTSVTNIGEGFIEAAKGNEKILLQASTVIWAAGVKATALTAILKEKTGVELDKSGRVKVNKDLSIPNFQDVFVIGDIAHIINKDGTLVPGLAPAAMQQGKYAAKLICKPNLGSRAFEYFDKGNMAVIGKGRAVVETGKLRLTGFPAWMSWAFIHIYFLIEFENKLIVFIRWAWNYLTNRRGSRLITHRQKSPE